MKPINAPPSKNRRLWRVMLSSLKVSSFMVYYHNLNNLLR